MKIVMLHKEHQRLITTVEGHYQISRLSRKEQVSIINRKYLLAAYTVSITSLLIFFGLLFNYLKLSEENGISRIPTEKLAIDVLGIMTEEEKYSRKNYKDTKSTDDYRQVIIGFPTEKIYKRLFEKHGYDTKDFSSLRKEYIFIINKTNNYLSEHNLVNFYTETSQQVDDKARVSDQSLYMQLAYHKKALLEKEMAAARTNASFLIKAKYKIIKLEYQGNQANTLTTILPMRDIEFISYIGFLEMIHPDLGPFRITIDSAIMEYLQYNESNPNKVNRAYALSVLGHVFYSGLLGQREDHSKALDYFVKSMEISTEIFHEDLIASTGLILYDHKIGLDFVSFQVAAT